MLAKQICPADCTHIPVLLCQPYFFPGTFDNGPPLFLKWPHTHLFCLSKSLYIPTIWGKFPHFSQSYEAFHFILAIRNIIIMHILELDHEFTDIFFLSSTSQRPSRDIAHTVAIPMGWDGRPLWIKKEDSGLLAKPAPHSQISIQVVCFYISTYLFLYSTDFQQNLEYIYFIIAITVHILGSLLNCFCHVFSCISTRNLNYS